MLNPLWAAPVQIGQCVSRRAENSCGSHLPQAPARSFNAPIPTISAACRAAQRVTSGAIKPFSGPSMTSARIDTGAP